LLKFSDVAALREADNCNIKTLKEIAASCCTGGLAGAGAETWGDVAQISRPVQKSLRQLSWGLLTGFFWPPDAERPQIEKVFKENLIVPHKGSKPDGLTQWVKQSFIPFYQRLREKELLPWLWHLLFWHKAVAIWLELRRVGHGKIDVEQNWEKKDSTTSSSSGATNNGSMTPPSPTTTNNSDASMSSIINNLNHYSGAWIERIASIITTVVACLLPVVAITILARVHSMGLILGLIAIFTAVFAVGLVLLSSSSSRVEIFTATAA
jgi:hypothetical protein